MAMHTATHITGGVVLWVLWLLCVFPLQFLETMLLGHVWHYLRFILKEDAASVTAAAVMGLVISNGIFQPLSNMRGVRSGQLCAAFLMLLSWTWGGVLAHMLRYSGCLPRVNWPRRLRSCGCSCRLRVLSGGAHTGLLVGLSFAFPVTAVKQYDTLLPLTTWCSPSPSVPMTVLCPILMLLAVLSVCMYDNQPRRSDSADSATLLSRTRLHRGPSSSSRDTMSMYTDEEKEQRATHMPSSGDEADSQA
jgi:hypothetical protein